MLSEEVGCEEVGFGGGGADVLCDDGGNRGSGGWWLGIVVVSG